MDRMTSMTFFVQVVDRGSFISAAKHLGVSPAMVSNHIQRLEAALGVQLLNRTTRKVSLTEAGSAYYERCTQILADIEDAERQASALQTSPGGTIRLNISVALARLVAPIITDYCQLYPEVSFDMIMSDRLVDLLEEKFDLALRTGPLPDSSLITRRLALGRLLLCAAPDYLAKQGTPEVPEDLGRHNALIYANSFLDAAWRLEGEDGVHEVAIAGNLRSNSIEGLRAAALAGQGICLLPEISIAEDIERGQLVPLLPKYHAEEVTIQAVYPPSRYLSAKMRTFLDFLASRWSGEPAQRSRRSPLRRPPLRVV